jgi:hypothetical protein
LRFDDDVHGYLREEEDVEAVGEQSFVGPGAGVTVGPLSLHSIDLRLWDRDATQQRVVRHPKMALRIVGRHTPLVPEIDRDPLPGNPF